MNHNIPAWYTGEQDCPVPVIFRRDFKRDGGQVFALFPTIKGSNKPGSCENFQHVGQHSTGDYWGCIQRSYPAKVDDPDVVDLKHELESKPYEYKLVVYQRDQPWFAKAREQR